jgi:hypothetical protein
MPHLHGKGTYNTGNKTPTCESSGIKRRHKSDGTIGTLIKIVPCISRGLFLLKGEAVMSQLEW